MIGKQFQKSPDKDSEGQPETLYNGYEHNLVDYRNEMI